MRQVSRPGKALLVAAGLIVIGVIAYVANRPTTQQQSLQHGREVAGRVFVPSYVPRGFTSLGTRSYAGEGFASREVRFGRGRPSRDPAAQDLLAIQTMVTSESTSPVQERLQEGVAKSITVRGHPGAFDVLRGQGVGTKDGSYAPTPEHAGDAADGIRVNEEPSPPGTPHPDIVTLVWEERPGVAIQIVSAALPKSEVLKIAASLREQTK